MSKKLGQEPAFGFGFKEEIPTPWSSLHSTQIVLKRHEGMSKRFYAACAAMQGILSGTSDYNLDSKCKYRDRIATAAYIIADELLKQENE